MSAPLTREAILFTQRFLKAQGYYSGELDGQWGTKTEDADDEFGHVSRFEASHADVPVVDSRSAICIQTLVVDAQVAARDCLKHLWGFAAGGTVKIISGMRTYAEQDALYEIGRAWIGGKWVVVHKGDTVTNAKGGQSNHNFGIAWDIGIWKDGHYVDDKHPAVHLYEAAGEIVSAEVEGVEWGGHWTPKNRDYPHYQLKPKGTMAEVRKLFEKGERYWL